ncbi:MAG: protein kinase [Candidatus Pelethousia sp.]|nr:protein kinase [Candidatus Pelethousia sp.]
MTRPFQIGDTALERYIVTGNGESNGIDWFFPCAGPDGGRHTLWACECAERNWEQFVRGLEAWKQLSHPNLIRLLTFKREAGRALLLVEQDICHMPATDALSGLYDETGLSQSLRSILLQSAAAIAYLHEKAFIHGDIKPANMRMDGGRLYLTELILPAGCYTPAFCSFEQLEGEPLTTKTDVYSWAVSAMSLILGDRPWANGAIAGLQCVEFLQECIPALPPALLALLQLCLARNAESRPSGTRLYALVQQALNATQGEAALSSTIWEGAATVFDPGATMPEGSSDATVPEGEATVLEGNVTLREDAAAPISAMVADSLAPNTPIQKGALLLNTYRVEIDPIESGNMGQVWRVHHTGWNVDLAMKRPRAHCFATESSKASFIHECEAWMDLGLHPNIVSCYYVREIGGIPSIFSEWMDGGSLADWIGLPEKPGRLYAGSKAVQQERLLDIAIQFARGLHYAHEYRDRGLIHQDVKPGNVLMTKEGEVKVADFGLARARALLTMPEKNPLVPGDYASLGKTRVSACGGYTPAYCSMEQMDGKPLTQRTDIYSWAVSMLEMYLGKRPWATGAVAGLNCRAYFEQARIPLSPALSDLLAQCLESVPEDRPHDFGVIEPILLSIYHDETGNPYPRPASKAAADTADSLNNRALSFLDLGREQAAEQCWERALQINAKHLESTYNHTLFLWARDRINAKAAIEQCVAADTADNSWRGKYYLSLIHSAVGKSVGAKKTLQQAKELEKSAAVTARSRALAKIKAEFAKNAGAAVCGPVCALSGDGRCIASESGNKIHNGYWRLALLDTETGEVLCRLQDVYRYTGKYHREIILDETGEYMALLRGFSGRIKPGIRYYADKDGGRVLRPDINYFDRLTLDVWHREGSELQLLFSVDLEGHAPCRNSDTVSLDGSLCVSHSIAFRDDGTIAALFKKPLAISDGLSEEELLRAPFYAGLLYHTVDVKTRKVQTTFIPQEAPPLWFGSHILDRSGRAAFVANAKDELCLWREGEDVRSVKLELGPGGISDDERCILACGIADGGKVYYLLGGVSVRSHARAVVYRQQANGNYAKGLSMKFYLPTFWRRTMCVSKDGRIAVVVDCTQANETPYGLKEEGQLLRFFDARSGAFLGAYELKISYVLQMEFSDGGERLVILHTYEGSYAFTSLDLSKVFAANPGYALCRIADTQAVLSVQEQLQSARAELEAALARMEIPRCLELLKAMEQISPQFSGSALADSLKETVFAHCNRTRFLGARQKMHFPLHHSDKVKSILLRDGTEVLTLQNLSSFSYFNLDEVQITTRPIALWSMPEPELYALAASECVRALSLDPAYLYRLEENRYLYRGTELFLQPDGVHKGRAVHKPAVSSRRALGFPEAISPDSRSFIHGNAITDLGSWQRFGLPAQVLEGNPQSICFSPDGSRLLYTYGRSLDAAVYDTQRGECIVRFTGHEDRVLQGAFIRNGRGVLTISADKTMREWDAQTGECLFTYPLGVGRGVAIALSPDGRMVLAQGNNINAELWDLQERKKLQSFRTAAGTIKYAFFNQDGSQVMLYATDKGGAWLYALDWEYEFPGQ